MGYSCNAAADYTRQAIVELISNRYGHDKISNYVPIGNWGGFWETGKEQEDGAITGSVWRTVSAEGHCRRAGSFRIEPDGKVTRFPGMDRQLLAEAERKGEARYQEYHGSPAIGHAETPMTQPYNA